MFVLCDPTSMIFLRRQRCSDREINGYQGLRGEGVGTERYPVQGVSRGAETALCLDCRGTTKIYTCVTLIELHMMKVNFTVC